MKKKFNLTAILAVVMVAMLSINLVSCTADEEYDNCLDGAYTLAQGIFDLNEESLNGINIFDQKLTFENVRFVTESSSDTIYVSKIICSMTYSDISNQQSVIFNQFNYQTEANNVMVTEYSFKKKPINRLEVTVKFSATTIDDSIYFAEQTTPVTYQNR